jgi:hypothetical protein
MKSLPVGKFVPNERARRRILLTSKRPSRLWGAEVNDVRVSSVAVCVLTIYAGGISVSLTRQSTAGAPQQHSPPPVNAARDAEKVRTEIRALEEVLPEVPDRGAMLFLMARRYTHVGDTQKALPLLKEYVALGAGFVPDPGRYRSLSPLESSPQFRELLEQARRRYTPGHRARVAFTVPAKDLFPEGFAVDTDKRLFYMGSMHHKNIVRFTLGGSVWDFVKQDVYDLSLVGGVHVELGNHSVWAATDAGEKHPPSCCISTCMENSSSETLHRERCHMT